MSKEKEGVSLIKKDILLDTLEKVSGMTMDGRGEKQPEGFAARVHLTGAVIFGSVTNKEESHDLDLILVSTINPNHYHIEYLETLKSEFDHEINRKLHLLFLGKLDISLGYLEPPHVDNPLAELQQVVIKNTQDLIIFAFNSIGAKQINEVIEEIRKL